MFWNCTWRTGLDELGKPAHGPIACCLWSKGPKEGLERSDDTFEAHFGRQMGSCPPRAVLFGCIEGRAKQAGVRPPDLVPHACAA